MLQERVCQSSLAELCAGVIAGDGVASRVFGELLIEKSGAFAGKLVQGALVGHDVSDVASVVAGQVFAEVRSGVVFESWGEAFSSARRWGVLREVAPELYVSREQAADVYSLEGRCEFLGDGADAGLSGLGDGAVDVDVSRLGSDDVVDAVGGAGVVGCVIDVLCERLGLGRSVVERVVFLALETRLGVVQESLKARYSQAGLAGFGQLLELEFPSLVSCARGFWQLLLGSKRDRSLSLLLTVLGEGDIEEFFARRDVARIVSGIRKVAVSVELDVVASEAASVVALGEGVPQVQVVCEEVAVGAAAPNAHPVSSAVVGAEGAEKVGSVSVSEPLASGGGGPSSLVSDVDVERVVGSGGSGGFAGWERPPRAWGEDGSGWMDEGYVDAMNDWFERVVGVVDESAFFMDSFVGRSLQEVEFTGLDALRLVEHVGRRVWHVSADRRFERAWFKRVCDECREAQVGVERPVRLKGCTSSKCGRFPRLRSPARVEGEQYVMLCDSWSVPVIVADIDVEGRRGGSLDDMDVGVRERLELCARHGIAPNFVGVNRANGRVQAMWLVQTAYRAKGEGVSASMRLAKQVARDLQEFVGADLMFSNRFSRNPLYRGADGYRWWSQHHRVVPLQAIAWAVHKAGGMVRTGVEKYPSHFKSSRSSGRELLEAAIEARRAGEALAAYAAEFDACGVDVPRVGVPGVVQGVKVRWLVDGDVPARDETAFRHALWVAYRSKRRGVLCDEEIVVNAYMWAYEVACRLDKSKRAPEMPTTRDMHMLAKRVLRYVDSPPVVRKKSVPVGDFSPVERATLATMGSVGGRTTAKRRAENRDDETSIKVREGWARASARRHSERQGRVGEALAAYKRLEGELGRAPSGRELAEEMKKAKSTVNRYLKILRDACLIT